MSKQIVLQPTSNSRDLVLEAAASAAVKWDDKIKATHANCLLKEIRGNSESHSIKKFKHCATPSNWSQTTGHTRLMIHDHFIPLPCLPVCRSVFGGLLQVPPTIQQRMGRDNKRKGSSTWTVLVPGGKTQRGKSSKSQTKIDVPPERPGNS